MIAQRRVRVGGARTNILDEPWRREAAWLHRNACKYRN
jgi:hypothetical protein